MTDQTAPDNNSFVVGIGASAGGLEALEEFFDALSPTDDAAFVVVQHLSPDYRSMMSELLAKHTAMPVVEVEDGMEVRGGHVYLIPRRSNMTIFGNRLYLSNQQAKLNLPIDMFFESLAEESGDRAIGIVVSGTGSDGTRGVRAIKEAGGMVMVQTAESAKFDGMPRSAIATGIADYVLPPARMPAELQRFFDDEQQRRPIVEARIGGQSSGVARILMLIKRRTGVDLSLYKESTIVRRLERRMGITRCESEDAYLQLLHDQPREITALYKEILIGVTRFFRDAHAFDSLAERVIPEILAAKHGGEPIRVWVAGCSTGEEAYSVAITLAEQLEQHDAQHAFKVFATDVDKDAIEFASYGLYPESIAADVSPERLARHFVHKGDSFQILPAIRERVIFAYHNAFADPPFRKIDLISCRNLMIYVQPTLQTRLLDNFDFSLNADGFLFLGSSETVGDAAELFAAFDVKWKIYRHRTGHTARKPPAVDDGSTQSPASVAARTPATKAARSSELQQAPADTALQGLVEQVLPPSVIVNEYREVIHIFGDVSDMLHLPYGRMQLDLMKMAREEISLPLSNAIQKAIKDDSRVTINDVPIVSEGEAFSASISVWPIDGALGTRQYAVLFTRSDHVPTSEEIHSFDLDKGAQERIQNLEEELRATQEELRTTIEELETSNEELQATNEELLSSNEELQSTNEELQSVNEELITVNAEYQTKIEELSVLNDDMLNLLSATNIGTLFLDMQLRIRKFTPSITELFNIIKTDVGRPISDLSYSLVYPDLVGDVQTVAETHEFLEKEVPDKTGAWFMIRIGPYLSEDERPEGVVVTIIDITRRKVAEHSYDRQRQLVASIVEANPVAITMVDLEGRITFANPRARTLLDLTENDRTFDAPEFTITDEADNPIPSDQLPFPRIMASRQEVRDFRHYIAPPNRKRTLLSISGSPMYDDHAELCGAVFTLVEVVT